MTYPSDRWRRYVDNIAIRSRAPIVAEIFACMKMLEERQNARDEAEHGEANYAGRGGVNRGFGGGGHQHQQQQQPLRQKFGAKAAGMVTSMCYCCEKTGHYANKCSIRLTAFCNFCKAQGHILTTCKRKNNDGGGFGGGAGVYGGSASAGGQGGGANQGRPPMQPRPKFLPHGKKAQARGGAVAFVFEEVMAANVRNGLSADRWN